MSGIFNKYLSKTKERINLGDDKIKSILNNIISKCEIKIVQNSVEIKKWQGDKDNQNKKNNASMHLKLPDNFKLPNNNLKLMDIMNPLEKYKRRFIR